MKLHNIIITLVASVMFCAPVYGQTNSSAYFLEGSYTRYMLNPAFQPERAFVSFPGLSNVNVNSYMNTGLASFLYESKLHPGRLTTFMSSDVSRDEFLSVLPGNTRMGERLDMNLVSFGFGGDDWYSTVSINIRDAQNVIIPKSMFSFLKSGLSNGDYSVNDLEVSSITYAEIALNFSKKVIDNLTVGGTVRLLEGAAYAKAVVNSVEANLSDKAWNVQTDASILFAVPGGRLKLNEDNVPNGFDYSFKMPSNYGFGLDLGAVYDMKDLAEGLVLSASVTNLGLINWKNVQILETDKSQHVEFNGFRELDVMNTDDDRTLDNLADDFADMIKLHEKKDQTLKTKLGATIRLGAEYQLPWVRWLSVGELLTTCPADNGFFESRTSINFAPLSWFELSGNVAFSHFGTSVGGIMNIHLAGLNLFFAADLSKMRLNPQSIPLDKYYADVNFGLNIPFGRKRPL